MFYAFFICFVSTLWTDNSPSVIVVTIPKSGSHLVKYIVSLVLNKEPIDVNTFVGYGPDKFSSYLDAEFTPETQFIMFHTEETPEIETYLRKYPDAKVILTVRNLKDLIVSAKDYTAFPYFDEYIFLFHSISMVEWASYNNKQHLIDTMRYFFLFQEKKSRRFNMAHFVQDAISLVGKYPHTKVVKFEDFFRDHDSLLTQIHSIGEFLGKSLSQEELEFIAAQSIGNPGSHTYTDKKKINRFSEEFDDELMELFTRYFGELEVLYNRTFNYAPEGGAPQVTFEVKLGRMR